MTPRSTQSAYDIEMLRAERDSARAELAALHQRVAELEAAQADSLQAWADLWEHIAGRIGTGETPLPNSANFDAMLLPWAISE